MLKKAAALVLVCASVGICVSCGVTEGRLLYAAIPTANELVVYREDPNSGALTQLVGSPVAAGPGVRALVLHPNQKWLYAANSGENDVSFFTVATTGALTEKTPRTAVGTAPTLIAMDSAGSYLYVGNTGQQPSISVFSINSDGTLQGVPQTPGTSNTAYIGLTPINMTVSGNFLYVTGQGLQGYVLAFPLNNGVLGTPPAGSPYLAGNNPYGLAAFSASGAGFLYTANKLDNSISEFSIGTTGALTALPGSPISISFTGPTSLLIDPKNKYLFVADQGSGNLDGFSIQNPGGAINLLASAPFATKAAPTAMVVDSIGRYVLVAGQASPGTLQSFFLDGANGTLTLISSYSVAPGAATSMVMTK